MIRFASALAQVLSNPATGDNSDAMLKILIAVGVVCVVAIAALVLVPKFLRKEKEDPSDDTEIEEITEE